MQFALRRGSALLLALGLLGAGVGCGNDNSDRAAGLTTARADATVEGKVVVTGSSTVEPVSTLVAEAFRGQNGKVDISVEGPGTGDGMQRFCEGNADVTGASRPIEADELASCAAAGIDVVELPVGRDGVTVVVARANPVECLSFADLYALVGPEARGIRRWSEAEALAAELGSRTALPEIGLVVAGPGEESGTYDSFVEQVLAPVAEVRAHEGDLDADLVGTARADYASSANDNTIIEGVAAEAGGLGWVSFAFAEQADDVRAVPVAAETGTACVTPSRASIQDGSYPVARTLYLYVNRARAEERPAVAAFVDFYLAALDDVIELADYVPVAEPAAAVDTWETRTVVTAAGR